jgi:hypothetical protein
MKNLKYSEHDKNGIYESRIETKLTLRKIKVTETLSKMRMNSSMFFENDNKFYESTFFINTDKLELKSDILNKIFAQDDFIGFYEFYSELLKSNDLNKSKYAVAIFRNLIIGLDDKIPKELFSIEFLSSLYLLLNTYKNDFDLAVSQYYYYF